MKPPDHRRINRKEFQPDEQFRRSICLHGERTLILEARQKVRKEIS